MHVHMHSHTCAHTLAHTHIHKPFQSLMSAVLSGIYQVSIFIYQLTYLNDLHHPAQTKTVSNIYLYTNKFYLKSGVDRVDSFLRW